MNNQYLVRIKMRTKISHDMSYGYWPDCKPPRYEYENGGLEYRQRTLFPDALFIAEINDTSAKLIRIGYGLRVDHVDKSYGNGAIRIMGSDALKCLEIVAKNFRFK